MWTPPINDTAELTQGQGALQLIQFSKEPRQGIQLRLALMV